MSHDDDEEKEEEMKLESAANLDVGIGTQISCSTYADQIEVLQICKSSGMNSSRREREEVILALGAEDSSSITS
uniref:Ovule protein n=1 Tax=Caenorhabditis tropicalis TaxID=1561998 RepID=A0A1I7T9F0_9PELO